MRGANLIKNGESARYILAVNHKLKITPDGCLNAGF